MSLADASDSETVYCQTRVVISEATLGVHGQISGTFCSVFILHSIDVLISVRVQKTALSAILLLALLNMVAPGTTRVAAELSVVWIALILHVGPRTVTISMSP